MDSKQVFNLKPVLKGWAHDLPFKNSSIDCIVAFHILEHVPNPVDVVLQWLNMLKPGGGIGIVVPDWRYTWDARNDNNIWSHRWNPTPKLLEKLFNDHWSKVAWLEHFNTLKWKLSFDVILIKYGDFVPFRFEDGEKVLTGKELWETGTFCHLDDDIMTGDR